MFSAGFELGNIPKINEAKTCVKDCNCVFINLQNKGMHYDSCWSKHNYGCVTDGNIYYTSLSFFRSCNYESIMV